MAISVIVPQAPSVAKKELIASSARTSSDNTNDFPVDFFSSAEIVTVVTTCSGTLDVYVQKLLPDNATYSDLVHFAQYTTAVYTTTGTIIASFLNSGNSLDTSTDAALAADTILTAFFGAHWRIKFVIAGTGATATFGVYGSFRI